MIFFLVFTHAHAGVGWWYILRPVGTGQEQVSVFQRGIFLSAYDLLCGILWSGKQPVSPKENCGGTEALSVKSSALSTLFALGWVLFGLHYV